MDLGKEKLTVLVTYWWNGDLVSDCCRTHSCLATFPHSPSISLLLGESQDYVIGILGQKGLKSRTCYKCNTI